MAYYILKSIDETTQSRGIRSIHVLELLSDGETINTTERHSWSVGAKDKLFLKSINFADALVEYRDTLMNMQYEDVSTINGCLNSSHETSLFTKEMFEIHKSFLLKKTNHRILTGEIVENFIENEVSEESQEIIEDVDFYFKIITDYFGEENVFIDKDRNRIVIFFPEKQVTNSNNAFHKIYNVYVFIDYMYGSRLNDSSESNSFKRYFIKTESSRRGIRFDISHGARTLFSEEEKNSGYVFSHFSRNLGSSCSCCLGSGTALSQLNERTLNNEESILGFCIALDKYLEWESLEGGPYIKISEIRTVNNSSQRLTAEKKYYDTIFTNIIKSEDSLILNIDENFNINIDNSVLAKHSPYFKQKGSMFTLEISKLKSLGSFKKKETTSETKVPFSCSTFKFKDKTITTAYYDPSLNKTKDLDILSKEYEPFYPNTSSFISNFQNYLIDIIKNDNGSYTKTESAFKID